MVDHPRRGQAIAAQPGDEGLGGPVSERRIGLQPGAAARPAAQTGHLCRRAGLVEEDQSMDLPRASAAGDASSTPHAPDARPRARSPRPAVFFLKLRPAFSSTRDNEAGCAVTFFSAASLAASSGIVMSGSASTHSSRAGRCAASLPLPGGRPWRAGSAEPVRDDPIDQLYREAGTDLQMPGRSSTRRPLSTTACTRSRRSIE